MNSENLTGIDAGEATTAAQAPAEIPTVPAEQPAPVAGQVSRSVLVLGIGNAGSNLVDTLIREGFPSSACAVLNSDASATCASLAAEKISMDDKLGRGIGCGGDSERGRAGAESSQAAISALCKDKRAVVLVCGMGGGAGTGGAPVAARLAKAAGAIVVCVSAMPFECEGALRGRIAENGIVTLRKEADLVLPFRNDRAVAAETPTSVLDTFKSANELLACSIRCLCHAFTAGSVMGLPFSDICSLMQDRSEHCILATAEYAGTDRAGAAAEKLMAHPALDKGASMLAEADTVAVSVLGGPTLEIGEINRIVDRVTQESASSPLVMGAAIEPELGEKISVILLVGAQKENRPEPVRGAVPEQTRAPWPGDMAESGPTGTRPRSRIVPPPPEISPERARQIHARGRKTGPRMRQGQLQLDIISRGRFDRSEPTILKGEDLDIPTYVRKGISLN